MRRGPLGSWLACLAAACVGVASATKMESLEAAQTGNQAATLTASQATAQAGSQAATTAGAGDAPPLNVNQYTPAGFVGSVAPLMSRAWHAPSGFQTAHLANGMTMNVPVDLPSTAVYAPTGMAHGYGGFGGGVGAPVMGGNIGGGGTMPMGGAGMMAGAGVPGAVGAVTGHAMSALDPELAYVQQQQLAEKSRIAQEIQALQYEAAMRARDVAMANMGVHVAEQRLAHAQQLAHAVHARLAAAQRQLAALDVAQRRAADQSQLNQLQAALAEASASEAALSGARAGHESLVNALKASITAATTRVDAATGAIETILEGQGSKPTEIKGPNGVTSDIHEALHKQLDIAKSRSQAIEDFQKTLSNAVPSAADLVTHAHDAITHAGEKARAEAIGKQVEPESDEVAGAAALAGSQGHGDDEDEDSSGDDEDEDADEDEDEDDDSEDEDEDSEDGDDEDEEDESFLQKRASSNLHMAARAIAGRMLRGQK